MQSHTVRLKPTDRSRLIIPRIIGRGGRGRTVSRLLIRRSRGSSTGKSVGATAVIDSTNSPRTLIRAAVYSASRYPPSRDSGGGRGRGRGGATAQTDARTADRVFLFTRAACRRGWDPADSYMLSVILKECAREIFFFGAKEKKETRYSQDKIVYKFLKKFSSYSACIRVYVEQKKKHIISEKYSIFKYDIFAN